MAKTEIDILREIALRLDNSGIPFMLTGSVAMNYYAQPRMTRDIDLVIALTPADADRFVRAFEDDFYLDREVIEAAIERRSMFNLIHLDSIIKVDCIIRKDEPYRLEEFERRKEIRLGDFRLPIVSREDLILSKLAWAKDSGSELQFRDVRNLYSSECDLAYLSSRAILLSVSDLLDELVKNYE